MRARRRRELLMRGRSDAPSLAVAVSAAAVICCASLPTIAGVLGGITIAGALRVVGGSLAIAIAVSGSVLLVRVRRRRGRRHTETEFGPVKIELLYFDGCPNHETLLPRLRELLGRAGISSPVEMINVPDAVAAERQRFLGSPTLRVNGRDVEPAAELRTDFGLKCRLYRTEGGFAGAPLDEWVLDALNSREPL
ncbi:MAG TPA: hypothetical protein VFH80_16360 [Solirubrobacteraceae bacterium]|nr:hypothetical protein [Solirubrobacteraceae bacterium]